MRKSYFLALFLLFQIVLLQILPYFPEHVETKYSQTLYPILSRFLRSSLGGIPFSVGDVLYFILILFLIRWVWNLKKSWLSNRKKTILGILNFCSVLYFFFHFLWGYNYYRQPLHEKLKLQKEYSNEDLLLFTEKLIVKTNAIHLEITGVKNKKVMVPYNAAAIFKMNQNGYDNLAKEFPFLKYEKASIKKSLWSTPLTYMGFGGYLNPFTNEAQVNSLGPMYSFAMTTNHEMAHQIGYASESECNFIGFMASTKNTNPYIKYSGYSLALRYCLANWQARDEKQYQILLKKINPGIIQNYKESIAFWEQYDTFIDAAFHAFYDQFLKLNQQQDGLNSYSKYVDLMVNYYKNKPL